MILCTECSFTYSLLGTVVLLSPGHELSPTNGVSISLLYFSPRMNIQPALSAIIRTFTKPSLKMYIKLLPTNAAYIRHFECTHELPMMLILTSPLTSILPSLLQLASTHEWRSLHDGNSTSCVRDKDY
jgi:hypothetical protein